MAFPPTDKEPSELFLKLTEAPRPSEVIDFPRYDAEGKSVAKVRIQVLNLSEYDQARISAQDWLDKKFPNKDSRSGEAAKEVLGDRIAKEVLARATLSVEPIRGSEEDGKPRYNRIFRGADDVDALLADELTSLWMSQQMVQTKYGPYEGNIADEGQVSAWMRVLVEGASALPLAALSWHQLTELTMCLAERAYSLSVVLGSPCLSLPNTLDAARESWALGTFGLGKLPAKLTKTGLSRSDLGLPDLVDEPKYEPVVRLLPDEPIDAKMASRIASGLYKTGRL